MIRVCVHVCVCADCRWTTSLRVCVHSAHGGREIASPRKSALHLPPADRPAYITTLLPVRCTSPSALSLYYPFIPCALYVSFPLSHPLFVPPLIFLTVACLFGGRATDCHYYCGVSLAVIIVCDVCSVVCVCVKDSEEVLYFRGHLCFVGCF